MKAKGNLVKNVGNIDERKGLVMELLGDTGKTQHSVQVSMVEALCTYGRDEVN